jgi:hypothetical protein
MQVQIKSHHRARGVQQGKCHHARILKPIYKSRANTNKFIENWATVKFPSSIPPTIRCFIYFTMATFSQLFVYSELFFSTSFLCAIFAPRAES